MKGWGALMGGEQLANNDRAVILVTDVPLADMHTGIRRRVAHLIDWLESNNATYEIETLHATRQKVGGLRQSLANAQEYARLRLGHGGDDRRLIVAGFGSVALSFAAVELTRSGTCVTFDQCDSLVTQFAAAIRRQQWTFALHVLVKIFLWTTAPRNITVSYISTADQRRDRIINIFRKTTLVKPTVPKELRDLPPVGDPIRRIVAVGDFASPHIAEGMEFLFTAVSHDAGLNIELFGPVPPQLPTGSSITYLGFVEDLRDVYRGDTAVYIPNVGGSGVPNKLLEAVAAGRPVIVHESLLSRPVDNGTGWVYKHAEDVRSIVYDIARGAKGKQIPFRGESASDSESIWTARPAKARRFKLMRRNRSRREPCE